MSDYLDLIGLIAFPVAEKNVNGKPIREAVIHAMNKDGLQVRCTVWDNFAHVPLKQGDFIAVGGKASNNPSTKADGTQVVYHNLSVSRLSVVESAVPSDSAPAVSNTKATPNVDEVF